jgi:hypothetical protein
MRNYQILDTMGACAQEGRLGVQLRACRVLVVRSRENDAVEVSGSSFSVSQVFKDKCRPVEGQSNDV